MLRRSFEPEDQNLNFRHLKILKTPLSQEKKPHQVTIYKDQSSKYVTEQSDNTPQI
jgi:hypothetical protein